MEKDHPQKSEDSAKRLEKSGDKEESFFERNPAVPFFNPVQKKAAFFKASEQTQDREQLPVEPSHPLGMPKAIMEKMEDAFETDFSDVEIHRDSMTARNLDALAYTQGAEIHFAPQVDPYAGEGQEILGHELSHVIQQREGMVSQTHTEKGMPVNADATLEEKAHQEGKNAVQGKKTRASTDGRPIRPAASRAVVQLWRDVPGQARIESTAPDTAAAWGVFMQAAYGAASGYTVDAEGELRAAYYGLISQRLRGSFQPINIHLHTTSGYNLQWEGSVRFVFGDQELPVPGGGTAQSTLQTASDSAAQRQSTDGSTTGTSAQISQTPGEGGGTGGQVGGQGGQSSQVQNTQGDTQTAGSSSAISQSLLRYASAIGIEVYLSASYDMGSSWTDWVNPMAYGSWGGVSIITDSKQVVGLCGSVVYFKGAGIAR